MNKIQVYRSITRPPLWALALTVLASAFTGTAITLVLGAGIASLIHSVFLVGAMRWAKDAYPSPRDTKVANTWLWGLIAIVAFTVVYCLVFGWNEETQLVLGTMMFFLFSWNWMGWVNWCLMGRRYSRPTAPDRYDVKAMNEQKAMM